MTLDLFQLNREVLDFPEACWSLHCSGHCPKLFHNIWEMLGKVVVEVDENGLLEGVLRP